MTPTLDQLLDDRRGVVLRSELYAAGIGPRGVSRQIAAGIWTPSGRSVLIHESAAPGLRTDTLVAALRNPDAPLTGTSAALLRPHPAWSGLDFDGAPAMIIAPSHRHGPWLTVRHPGAGVDIVAGLRVADLHTTLVDLLRSLDWPLAAAVAGSANQAGLTSQEWLDASVRGLARLPGLRNCAHS